MTDVKSGSLRRGSVSDSAGFQTTTESVARSSSAANRASRSSATSHIQQMPDSARKGERRPVGPLTEGNGTCRRTLATMVSGAVVRRM